MKRVFVLLCARDSRALASAVLSKIDLHAKKPIDSKELLGVGSILRSSPIFKQREDRTLDYKYSDQRELDAVARCVAAQEPCTAVVKHSKSHFLVAFNHDKGCAPISLARIRDHSAKQQRIKIESDKIDQYISTFKELHKTGVPKALLCHVLKYSLGYSILKQVPIEVQLMANTELAKFHAQLEHAKYSRVNAELLTHYGQLLRHMQVLGMKKEFDALIMPFQDVMKLLKCLPCITEIEILSNPLMLHAEVNAVCARDKLEHAGKVVEKYIGISKLSCFLCEVIIQDHPHRGTHGLLYQYASAKDIILDSPVLCERLLQYIETAIANDPIFHIAGIYSLDDFINADSAQILALQDRTTLIIQESNLSCDESIERSICCSDLGFETSLHEFKKMITGDIPDHYD